MRTTRAWRALMPAALLGALAAALAGCASGGDPDNLPSASGTISSVGLGPRAFDPGASAAGCAAPWAGLNDLSSLTTWLRRLIGDEVIFGADTRQARQDGQAVIGYAQSLNGFAATLPARYVPTLRDSVLPAATRPFTRTPEQLNTAANAAQTLNDQLDVVC